ncbi:unannotated protein [freshwater metagenome]|uniref:Unannotated protein n=1 Tax=freshwater metagenome TaxID=449393 RepID=A0A6J6JRC5_9ZZZZ
MAHIEVIHRRCFDARQGQAGKVIKLDICVAKRAGRTSTQLLDPCDEFWFTCAVDSYRITKRWFDSLVGVAEKEPCEVRLRLFGSLVDHRTKQRRIGASDADRAFVVFRAIELRVSERVTTGFERHDEFLKMAAIGR